MGTRRVLVLAFHRHLVDAVIEHDQVGPMSVLQQLNEQQQALMGGVSELAEIL